jgi:hypothetical protein
MSRYIWRHKTCGGEIEVILKPLPPITPPPETICRCTNCHGSFADAPQNNPDLVEYVQVSDKVSDVVAPVDVDPVAPVVEVSPEPVILASKDRFSTD